MSACNTVEQSERDQQKTREWKFALSCSLIVSLVILIIFGLVHGVFTVPDPPLTFEKIPNWAAVIGTALGAIGASTPKHLRPVSKWRDIFAVFGWAVLIIASLIALLYGSQWTDCDCPPLHGSSGVPASR